MKKILFIIAIILIAFSSCKKKNQCATCTEKNSGYKASDYCGTPTDVDKYIDELYRQGGNAGQNWECSKHDE
ncbi:MAG: hypothetical protein NTU98_06230 [Bacteroidetes bacterium]|nr:hypothetical protein [Bacteroidota bacterium]